MGPRHREFHRSDRIGWLRAAVLGANDGTISVASLVVGVAASGASKDSLLLTGVAGLVAGAMSMAAGEYVSVQSQADTEAADMAKERGELEREPERELAELTAIYVERGLDSLGDISDKENDIMDKAAFVRPESRLGCQACVSDEDVELAISDESLKAWLDEHPELRRTAR